ncbi:MAG: translation initiation factor IF-2 [Candidatus Onthovivens sp.]|nr:translation initiation factor IF-2 [Mollicutes bacterium]MDY4857340.1 translation initiation factor IF-2 [Candidatus Onthovivens sp.]
MKKKDERISNVEYTNKPNKDYAKVNKGGVFVFTKSITVGELAKELNVGVGDIIKKLFLKNKMVTINQYLDDETIGELCLEFGYDFKKEEIIKEEDFEKIDIQDNEEDLEERPPVVTVMGHVDHGKTTLIDAIRNSNLAGEEFGGISQEIGAYQKVVHNKKITFIDTPGHEAFSAMRMRGASVTDIVVLVVAADDGVMPQTIEAIDHAKAAKVPIIVAINKMDAPGADPEKVMTELMQHDIIAEKYGGENIVCLISAKKKQGIDELLDAILLQAEMLELKANPKRYAIGTVLEANLDKGEGPKATLLVQNGTLTNSDYIVVGTAYGKVRRMTNEHNQILKEATPSTPVSVIGLSDVPLAGDRFMAFPSEKQAKEIASKRQLRKVEEERANSNNVVSLDDLYNKIQQGNLASINIVLKADSTGSAEACKSSLEKLNSDQVKIKVVRAAPGAITESDILLAGASNAIIYGFNVRPSALVRKKAEEEKIEIRLHRIIYALIEEVQDAIKGLIKKEEVEHVLGQAEVRNVFKVSKVGTVAGCYVTDGEIRRDALCRLLRDGTIIYEGRIETLKRFKDDAKVVNSGYECGIKVENFNDVHEGDIIENYELKVEE